jgi:glycosyltransferase involved in cell wall biosynthesis
MRLAVYTDFAYRRTADGVIWADQPFSLFMTGLRPWVEQLTLVGRLDPDPRPWHFRVPADVRFVALPHYAALSDPAVASRAMAASLRRFWRLLGEVDAVWLLGPHPLGLAFAAMAAARRRRIAIGVRQDLPALIRSRHPGRRGLHAAALALEGAWRALARLVPVVVVGPDLAARYAGARRVLSTSVSLISERDLELPAAAREWEAELRVLSVGRLDAEKNPLLLADVLARLVVGGGSWRLVVCGEGPLRGALEARLAELGVADRAQLLGYVPADRGLREVYRSSHALLHVSWTEGVPGVLIEAFANRLPVVATAVGGVAGAVGDAALLVAPGDADAAADALRRLAADPQLRARLTADGMSIARRFTLEGETRRIVELIAGREL